MKRQDWKEHWQVDTPEQVANDMLWKSRALQDLVEALPPMKSEKLQAAASRYEANTGVGTDGLRPKQ